MSIEKRQTTTTRIAGTIALFATLALAPAVLAQPASGGPDGPFMRGGPRGILPGLRALDLEEGQRDRIREIAEQNRDAGAAMAQQVRAAREALNDVVVSEVVNESTIRARAAELATLEADAAVQRAYVSAQILQVLTPDQRAEWRELRADAKERAGERRGRQARRQRR